jgi:uncharacterized protein (TIGR02147 family)
MILDQKQLLANLLEKKFNEIKNKNPRYSLRAFSKKLEISSSSLSEILSGKRKVSSKMIAALLDRLDLTETESKRFKKLLSNSGQLEKLKTKVNSRPEVILDRPNFDLMSDWRYFALMALTRTTNFKSDEAWISKRLGISLKDVKLILTKLENLNIIKRNSFGTITDNNACYRTPEDYPETLGTIRQIDGLKFLIDLLEAGSDYQRGCYSTISTDVRKLPEAFLMIEDFMKRLSLFLADSDHKEEVFELQIQLFPRTHQLK